MPGRLSDWQTRTKAGVWLLCFLDQNCLRLHTLPTSELPWIKVKL